MVDDRIDKLRAVVQSTIGIAQSLETRVAARQLSREQALSLLRDDVHAMRFDAGDGYVFAQTLDNMLVLHGIRDAAAPTEMTSARADRPSSNVSLVRTLRRLRRFIH